MVATTLLNVEPSKGKLEIQRMFDFEMTSHGLLAPVVLNSFASKAYPSADADSKNLPE